MDPRIEHVSALEGYERWAETYDLTPNPVVAMDARHTLRVLDVQPGEHVLDAGCGTGRHFAEILSAGARPMGVDFSRGMLAVAHRLYPKVPLAVADLHALPLPDGSFDAAICALVGEHLEDLPASLAELRRVVKPGGRLVFSVYHPEMAMAGKEANFQQNGIEYRLGAYKYSVQEYLDVIVAAGFPDLAFREYRGDSQMASDVPSAVRLVGFPVLLLIAAVAE